MKSRIILTIFALNSLFASAHMGEADSPVCIQLDSLLDQFLSENPRAKVVRLVFERLSNLDIVTLSAAQTYQRNFVDGYFYKNDRLITYYSMDCKNRSNIIHYEHTKAFKGSIPGYRYDIVSADTLSVSNHVPISVVYHIKSRDNFIRIDSDSYFLPTYDIATSREGIFHDELNHQLNSYINNNFFVAYELTFSKSGRKRYVSLKGTFYYDKSLLDAYFYRNNHLVLVYGLNDARDIVDMSYMERFTGVVPNCREAAIAEYLNNPIPEVFQIVGRKRLKRLRGWLFGDTLKQRSDQD